MRNLNLHITFKTVKHTLCTLIHKFVFISSGTGMLEFRPQPIYRKR